MWVLIVWRPWQVSKWPPNFTFYTLYQDFVAGFLSDYYILYVTEHGGFRKCTFPRDLENRMCDYYHLFAISHHVSGSAILRLMAAIWSKFRMSIYMNYVIMHLNNRFRPYECFLSRKVLSHHFWSTYKFQPLDYIQLWRHEFELASPEKMATCLFCLCVPTQTADHIQCWIRIVILFRKPNHERIWNVWNRRLTYNRVSMNWTWLYNNQKTIWKHTMCRWSSG